MSGHSNRFTTRVPELIHHAASSESGALPNSLAAIQDCLAAGAKIVEIDLIPLVDGDFALLHDPRLENATNGSGNVAEASREQVQGLFFKYQDQLTDTPVGTLSQVIPMLQLPNNLTRLQLDLKPYAPLTPAGLTGLLKMIAPVKDRMQISSVADWAVRTLHKLDPNLRLGFDPLLYLDLETSDPRPVGVPPFRVGAYGYRDDHPLSSERWGPDGDYLADRAEALLVQAAPGAMWYVNAQLLIKALHAGFDWINFLHENGSRVAAWTLDAGQSNHVAWAKSLAAAGVDAITTNTPIQLAQELQAAALSG
jgi:glycerophosphoryl diester phosphodiesterase